MRNTYSNFAKIQEVIIFVPSNLFKIAAFFVSNATKHRLRIILKLGQSENPVGMLNLHC